MSKKAIIEKSGLKYGILFLRKVRTHRRLSLIHIFQSELGLPVKYIGVGEHIDDLQKFNADDFVNALFNVSEKKM